MSSKKWFISIVSITMVFIVIFGALQFYLDPLLQYGGERGPLTYRTYTEIYCNPGIAKNYDYNAVLLGSSMVENTDINELNEAFGCKTIKVTYAGGSSYNHKKILDVCYDSGHKIDKVFWALDEYALTTDVNTPRWPLPEYLYDENQLNDVSYLLNLDIFYYYSLIDLVATIKHQNKKMMSEGVMVGGDESLFGKEKALSTITYPMEQKDNKGKTYNVDKYTENLNKNILPFIEKHPETEFHFFMVPYSIFYWYQQKREGLLESVFYNLSNVMAELLSYDNVNIHFFQDEKNIITNLDLYKDYTHYKPEVISWMVGEMKKDSHLLSKETYNQTLNNFFALLNAFDYDKYYQQQLG